MTQSGRQEGARGNRRVPRQNAPMRSIGGSAQGARGVTGTYSSSRHRERPSGRSGRSCGSTSASATCGWWNQGRSRRSARRQPAPRGCCSSTTGGVRRARRCRDRSSSTPRDERCRRAGCRTSARVSTSSPRQRHECSAEPGRRAAGGAGAVGASLHPARGTPGGEPRAVAASRPSRCSAGRPSGSPAPTSFEGLRLGLGVGIYFGHGRPKGWAGYHGLRASHLVEAAGEPLGALFSVTCLTANRWRVGLSFSEAVVTGGAAAAAVGAVDVVAHMDEHALDARPRRLAPLGRVPPRAGAACGLDARGLADPVPHHRRPARAPRRHRRGRPPRRARLRSRSGARSLTEVEIEDELRAIVAEVAEIDAGSIDLSGDAGRRGRRLVDGDGDRRRRRAALRAQLHGRGTEGDHHVRQSRRADADAAGRAGGRIERAVITGLGVVSPVGADVETFWAALLVRHDGRGPGRVVRHVRLPVRIGCEVRGLALESTSEPRPGRAALLAAAAGRQALAQAGLARNGGRSRDRHDDGRELLARSVGSGGRAVGHRPGRGARPLGPDQIGRDVASELGLGGRVAVLAERAQPGTTPSATRSTSSGSDGPMQFSPAEPTRSRASPSRVRAARSPRDRGVPAVQCRPRRTRSRRGRCDARRRVGDGGRRPRRGAAAELAGIGLSGDAFHIVSPDPKGRGATRAMEAALEDAGADRREIGYLSAHGTGTPANDRAEVAAARAVFGKSGPPMSSIKAITGHGLGAASALEAVACVQALRGQIAPPTWNFTRADPECDWDGSRTSPENSELGVVVSNAYAFGGANAALVCGRPAEWGAVVLGAGWITPDRDLTSPSTWSCAVCVRSLARVGWPASLRPRRSGIRTRFRPHRRAAPSSSGRGSRASSRSSSSTASRSRTGRGSSIHRASRMSSSTRTRVISGSSWLAGPNVTLCGEAAGLEALGQALDLLELGRADAVLAGGVEAYGETLYEGLRRAGRTNPRRPQRSCSAATARPRACPRRCLDGWGRSGSRSADGGPGAWPRDPPGHRGGDRACAARVEKPRPASVGVAAGRDSVDQGQGPDEEVERVRAAPERVRQPRPEAVRDRDRE